MIVSVKDIETLKTSIKIGEHVNYRTPVYSIEENPRYAKKDNDAVVVEKLKRVVVVEYMAVRGKRTEPARGTMPYKEIYMQRIGEQY
ncbi:hypothetical protein [Clostridium sp. HBUAS56010]|uniref:hypothetical protein n=1 Tax=Clostridium sp. HBUAS56010 TaxID=2571127 RepID=UPI0011788F27|nr:hypothetical protein [Clostridium sp. HBUAS56010]